MKVRITCDGEGCVRWTEKGKPRAGWMVVLIYPLHDDESSGHRRHLCDRCSKRLEYSFR